MVPAAGVVQIGCGVVGEPAWLDGWTDGPVGSDVPGDPRCALRDWSGAGPGRGGGAAWSEAGGTGSGVGGTGPAVGGTGPGWGGFSSGTGLIRVVPSQERKALQLLQKVAPCGLASPQSWQITSTAPSDCRQMRPSRTAYATAWVRLRNWSRVVRSCSTFFTVRSL